MAQDFLSAMSQVAGAFNSGFNAIADRQRFEQMANQLGLRLSNEAARQFDLTYENQKKQIEQQYRVALMQARTAEEAQRATAEYQRAQVALAEQRLALDTELGRGRLDLDRELGRGQLGNTLMSTLANMRGPANYYQAAEYARGVSQMPETPTFLRALMDNSRLPGFGAQGGLPTPESAETMLAKLTGDPSGGVSAPSEDNSLAAIGNIAARGAHQLGGGALERLTDTERQLFMSGLDELGVDTPTFLQQYARSRVGNRLSNARAA